MNGQLDAGLGAWLLDRAIPGETPGQYRVLVYLVS